MQLNYTHFEYLIDVCEQKDWMSVDSYFFLLMKIFVEVFVPASFIRISPVERQNAEAGRVSEG